MLKVREVDFIAFDIETTGISPDKDKIIEIGAVRFVNGKVVETFKSLCDPGIEVPPDATRVHGIRSDMLMGQPSPAAVIESFATFSGDSLLIAHNARFDVKFVSVEVTKSELQSPRGLVLDTYLISKTVMPELLNHRLESLVKHFSIKASKFHRALEDAEACGQVFSRLLRVIQSSGQPPLENLMNLSGGEIRFPQFAQRARQIGLF